MKSNVVSSFWVAYRAMDGAIRRNARKTYGLWAENPFHPSLHFKCINTDQNIWSVRITRGYRALCIWDGDTVTWFWIGNHHDYERFFS
ncbi:MAG: hypothetical protein ACLQT6_15260 [Desulfomonilaceae bacterium]